MKNQLDLGAINVCGEHTGSMHEQGPGTNSAKLPYTSLCRDITFDLTLFVPSK